MVTLKNQSELDRMREAGQVVGATLRRVADAVEPGVSLAELEAIGAACIKEHGARSSFLNYLPASAPTPYPATLCLSVNDVVVHGIPDGRVLADGDILSIDCGAEVGGYHGDAAVTVPVGAVDDGAVRLMDDHARGADSRDRGRGARRAARRRLPRRGGRRAAVRAPGGLRRARHRDGHARGPARAQHRPAGRGMRLREGLVIAIEPMLIEGGGDREPYARGRLVDRDRRRQPRGALRAHDRDHRGRAADPHGVAAIEKGPPRREPGRASS